MNICLFGSAFDPIHLGHQTIAVQMLEKKLCDEVWFVPVNQHPFGKKVEANGRRVEMIEAVIRNQVSEFREKMKISTYELEKEGKSYSFETLEFLSSRHPDIQFSWLMGSDNLEHFHLWKDYKLILKKYGVYVYPRKGFDFSPFYEGMIKVEDVPEIEISSTMIREKLQKEESISGLVHPEVERYIAFNKLYT